MTEIQDKVQLCADGKYRWAYEVNMYTNPTILYMMMSLLGGTYLVCLVLFTVINFFSDEDILMGMLMVTGIFVGIAILTIPAYLLVAAMMGGTYAALFVMDENGIEHHQMPKNVKKFELLSAIAGMTAFARGDFATTGLAINMSTAQTTKSEFEKINSVTAKPKRNLIKISYSWFEWNHIYVNDEYYDWVYDYIVHHCPKLSE